MSLNYVLKQEINLPEWTHTKDQYLSNYIKKYFDNKERISLSISKKI